VPDVSIVAGFGALAAGALDRRSRDPASRRVTTRSPGCDESLQPPADRMSIWRPPERHKYGRQPSLADS
jgi:hypothetical protein